MSTIPFDARRRVLFSAIVAFPMLMLHAQGGSQIEPAQHRPPPREIFVKVQEGLSSGSVAVFSRDIASPVHVNLRGSESGYYSPSQARYLIESYVKVRKLARFVFTTVDDSAGNPYATGSISFNYRGKREYAQLYVSLTFTGDRWMITQLNIY